MNVALNLANRFDPQPKQPLGLDEFGAPTVFYTSEAEMRTGLATLAHALGWEVFEELVIPGWGRIDLVLEELCTDTPTVLVELKLKLTRPADIRRAFQQADGYGRWWATSQGRPALTVLSAGTHDADAVSAVQDAYPQVKFCSASDLPSALLAYGRPASRLQSARDQASRLRDHIAFQDWAVAALAGIPEPK